MSGAKKVEKAIRAREFGQAVHLIQHHSKSLKLFPLFRQYIAERDINSLDVEEQKLASIFLSHCAEDIKANTKRDHFPFVHLADKGDWLFLSWLVDNHKNPADFNFLAGVDRSNFFQVLIKQQYDLRVKHGRVYQEDNVKLILSTLNRLAEKMSPQMISRIDTGGQSALWDAIKYDDFVFVTFLLSKNADLNILGVPDATNIYHHIVASASPNILEIVLLYDKDKKLINQPNAKGHLPITTAVTKGMVEHVKLLKANGAEFAPFADKSSYIHLAMNNPRGKDMLDYFYSEGMSVDQVDINNQTPLHIAVILGRFDLVLALLSKGAKIMQDKYGNTPIHLAAKYKQEKSLQFFLQWGKIKDQLSIRNGNDETVDDIVRFGAKENKEVVLLNNNENIQEISVSPITEDKEIKAVKIDSNEIVVEEENQPVEIKASEPLIVEDVPQESSIINEKDVENKKASLQDGALKLNPNAPTFTPKVSLSAPASTLWQPKKSFMKLRISHGLIVFENKNERPDFSQNLHPSLYIFSDLYHQIKKINHKKNWIDVFLGGDAALDALFNIHLNYPILSVYMIGLTKNQLSKLFLDQKIQITIKDENYLQISYLNQLINIHFISNRKALSNNRNQFSIQDVYIDLFDFESVCTNEETFNHLNSRTIAYNHNFNPQYLPDLFPAVELYNKLFYFGFIQDKTIKQALDYWNSQEEFITLTWQEMGLYTQFLEKELETIKKFVLDIEKDKSTKIIMDIVGTSAGGIYFGQDVKNDDDLVLYNITCDEFIAKLKKEGIEPKVKYKKDTIQAVNDNAIGPSHLEQPLAKPMSVSFRIGKAKFDVTCVADVQQRKDNSLKRDIAVTATPIQYYPQQTVFGLPKWILSIKAREIICTRDPHVVLNEEFKRKIRLLNMLKFSYVRLPHEVQSALYKATSNRDSDPFAIAMLLVKLLKNFGVLPGIMLLKENNLLEQILINDEKAFQALLGDREINLADQPLMENFYNELSEVGQQTASTNLLPKIMQQYGKHRKRKDLILIAKCLMGNASVEEIIKDYQESLMQKLVLTQRPKK